MIPVVASIPGKTGANFRTSVQLHNPGEVGILGRLVFHPQGRPGSDTDAFVSFVIPARSSVVYQNLLAAMGQSGIGSADLVVPTGTRILSIVRIFDDAGAKGTAGMTEAQVRQDEALREGLRGVLIAPVDLARKKRYGMSFPRLGIFPLPSSSPAANPPRCAALSMPGIEKPMITLSAAPEFHGQIAKASGARQRCR